MRWTVLVHSVVYLPIERLTLDKIEQKRVLKEIVQNLSRKPLPPLERIRFISVFQDGKYFFVQRSDEQFDLGHGVLVGVLFAYLQLLVRSRPLGLFKLQSDFGMVGLQTSCYFVQNFGELK